MLELITKNKDQLKYIIVDVGALLQIDASGEAVLSELVDSCSSAGIEILFSRTERLEAELFRSGFKKRFGENRFLIVQLRHLNMFGKSLKVRKRKG